MNTKIKLIIIQKAKKAAKIYFEEFGEALNPDKSDWDTEAFQSDFKGVRLPDTREAWDLYQDILVYETRRISKII